MLLMDNLSSQLMCLPRSLKCQHLIILFQLMYNFCEFVFQLGRQRRSSRWRRWGRYGGRRSATSVDWRRTTSACTGVSGPPCKCPNTSKGACVKVSPSVHVCLVWACCATTPTSRVTRTCCSPTHSSSRPNWLFLKPVSSKTWSSTASRDRLEFVSDCYRQLSIVI